MTEEQEKLRTTDSGYGCSMAMVFAVVTISTMLMWLADPWSSLSVGLGGLWAMYGIFWWILIP
jgi:hypothetical protein